jgi:ketosteroid isomerase-like protein
MFGKKAWIVIAGIFLIALANRMIAETPPSEWQVEVTKVDGAFWAAYNRADPKAMNSFYTDDVEFYHDRGGTVFGKAALSEVNNGMSASEYKIRRAAVPGTVRIFPMNKGDEIYGAIVSGEHQFYITKKDKPEFLAGRAYFTQLLLLKDKTWKISRIFSYEHVDAKK